ncbi:A/G-specific adenine glycosylase [Desulfospira joergensenii]|uniref:A/G-specific adenine glycosylase n=1 Tax=Desulfospira joergensenii TaxID=53329 RepID=UPI0003B5A0C8|nr:A/G-specific adenine glycosylase [Desulfospira joergensenii]
MKFKQTKLRAIRQALVAWYVRHRRDLPWRSTTDPYHIWISEVMAQQTRVSTVIPYYLAFVRRFPCIEDLAGADLDTVLKLWEGLGYYARARNFHRAAKIVSQKMGGRIPDDFEEFKKLPGVGDYIGAAVQSMAFGRAQAVVDGNVKRVLARIFCLDFPVNNGASHGLFLPHARSLLDPDDPGRFNQAMMELGALVCTPKNPGCSLCPLSQFCLGFGRGRVDEFPKRIPSKKVPLFQIAAGIVRRDGKLLITRRKPEGLLGGLWEFPGGKLKQGEDAETACIREIKEETGLTVKIDSRLTRVCHAYTHFKIEMEVFYCRFLSGEIRLNGPEDFRWIRLEEIDQFAFPMANLKFIPLIQAG